MVKVKEVFLHLKPKATHVLHVSQTKVIVYKKESSISSRQSLCLQPQLHPSITHLNTIVGRHMNTWA